MRGNVALKVEREISSLRCIIASARVSPKEHTAGIMCYSFNYTYRERVFSKTEKTAISGSLWLRKNYDKRTPCERINDDAVVSSATAKIHFLTLHKPYSLFFFFCEATLRSSTLKSSLPFGALGYSAMFKHRNSRVTQKSH